MRDRHQAIRITTQALLFWLVPVLVRIVPTKLIHGRLDMDGKSRSMDAQVGQVNGSPIFLRSATGGIRPMISQLVILDISG